MAEAVVSVVLQSIGNLLREETTQIAGVRDQINDLEAQLKRMQCFLKDADARAVNDDSIGYWVTKVKDIAYDVEDFLESYAFKKARSSSINSGGGISLDKVLKRCVCSSLDLNGCLLPFKFRSEIHRLKTQILLLQRHVERYGVEAMAVNEASSSSSSQKLLRRTCSFLEDEKEDIVVGLENDVKILVHHLVNDDDDVVSISGMDGLGKTTLAKMVYHHPDVKRHFAGFAWISVSQHWDRRNILKSIVQQLVPGEVIVGKHWGEEELVEILGNIIQKQKRCLIVLDDIRHLQVLMCVEFAFPTDHNGTKILLTTRHASLANYLDLDVFHFQPRLLSDIESRELFKRKALRGTHLDGDMARNFEMLGKTMVDSCQGLPLSLVVLAGILSTKNQYWEWEKVFDDIRQYYLSERSFDEVDEGGTFWTLALGYNYLPYSLKQCFLYLGSFPEDANIKAETLYQLWIAEGLVLMENLNPEEEEESMMKVAESYLGELATRGLVEVQISDVPRITKFESCRIHGMIRDLCLTKAREENFLRYKDEQSDTLFTDFSVVRRHTINWKHLPLTKETSNYLRMLRIVDPNESIPRMIESQFNHFKMLRVLSLEGIRPTDMWRLPKAFGKLILLRYLSLKDSSIFKLPSSLGSLKHLQTLDLRVFKLHKLPNILWKMARLTYLYLPSLYRLDRQSFKLRLDGLSKIEILENFSDQFCDPNDLPKLTNLQVLVVDCLQLRNLEMIANYASSNNRLKHVSIKTHCDFSSDAEILRQSLFGSKIHCFRSEGTISKFPGCEGITPISSSLVKLSMNLSGLKGDDVMGTLEKLMNLRTLCLWRFEGEEMIFHSKGFPQLRTLRLFSFLNMKKWAVEEKAMPNLSVLSIWGFTALETVPDGLRFITTLRELDIQNMPERFKARIRTQDGLRGEDYKEISHVPLVLSY